MKLILPSFQDFVQCYILLLIRNETFIFKTRFYVVVLFCKLIRGENKVRNEKIEMMFLF